MEERLQSKYRGSLNIALADDDADDRDLFAEAAGFVAPDLNIALTRDGEEFIEYLLSKQRKPDMVFLDLNMPKKNGKECLSEMQSNPDLRHIPVIIFTTSLNHQDVKETYELGARHFLRKPNSFQELKEILKRLLTADLSLERRQESFLLNPTDKLLTK